MRIRGGVHTLALVTRLIYALKMGLQNIHLLQKSQALHTIKHRKADFTDVASRMAEASAEPESALGEEKIECGYCYEYNDRLVTPKLLPCGHVGCLPCLQKDVKANTVLRCTF